MSLYIGMDLGGSNTRVVAIQDDGQISYSKGWPNPLEGGLACLELGIKSVEAAFGSDAVGSMGISISGVIKRDNSLAASNLIDLNGVSLAKLARTYGLAQDAFENDVRSAMRYFARFGLARDVSDCVLLSFGTGIGGAVMVERKIVNGWSNAAGEFGNMATLSANFGSMATYEYLASKAARKFEAYEYPADDPRNRKLGLSYSSPDFLILLTSLIVGVTAALDPEKIFLMMSGEVFQEDPSEEIQKLCAEVCGFELDPIDVPVIVPAADYICAAGAATRRLEQHQGLTTI